MVLDTRAFLITLMILSMTAVFIVAWLKTHSFRLALLLMLIVGTKWTIVISLFGYDRVLFTLYFINRYSGVVKQISITVCQVISLSYISLIVLSLVWPFIHEALPEEIRKDLKKMISYEEFEVRR